MNNKKMIWLGMVAILAIAPILVANLAALPPSPQAEAPNGADSANRPSILGAPQADRGPTAIQLVQDAPNPATNGRLGVVEVGGVERVELPRGPAPFLPIQVMKPSSGITLAGNETQPDSKDQDKKDPKIEEKKAPVPVPDVPTAPVTAPGGNIPSLGKLVDSAGGTSTVDGKTAIPPAGVGGLLANSSTAGVEVQRRSPLVGDPRIEGLHFGQIITQADGGYWFPARVDLDTVISKLNANNIDNILVTRGPFSVRYGPGFSFLDVESLGTPRNTQGGFDAHGSTTVNYRTNSHAWQGQQSFWGGNADWGFRLSYDAQAADDYITGNGTKLPSSYNNQFVNFAFGVDLSPTSSLEVKYVHAQQSNVIFPGLLTDINSLVSDGFTGRYTAKDGGWYDRLTVETWVNSTHFNGDSANPGTRQQIPALDNIFPNNLGNNFFVVGPGGPNFGPVRLDITTNGDALSYGFREITTWGDLKGFNVSVGADLRVFSNNYNEFDAFNLSVLNGTPLPANLGIPYNRLIDPGLLADSSIPVGENLLFKIGGRVDFTTTQFLGFGPNVDPVAYNATVGAPADRAFFLFAGFLTAEYKITREWTVQVGYGYAQRQPTATELYTGGAFLGLIQNGLNSIFGNPNLRKEEMHQLNLGLTGKYENVRVGGNAFYSFVEDYITYDNLGPFTVTVPGLGAATTPINRLRFVNTPLATLYGFDAYGEYDALPWLTPYATLNFVEGWDQSRNEALPGIPPLSARVGLRFHEPEKNPKWVVEAFARMVATQDLFASSLGEQRTGGFVIYNLRGFWQVRENLLLMAGVENIGNRQYQEHLDLRTGAGVFQPGFNLYVGVKVSY